MPYAARAAPDRIALRRLRAELDQVPLLRTAGGAGAPWIAAAPQVSSAERWSELEAIGAEVVEFLERCQQLAAEPELARRIRATLPPRERDGLARISTTSRPPLLVRPDLVHADDGRLWMVELDLVPAGLGMVQRLQEILGLRPSAAELWTSRAREPIVLSVPEWKIFVPEQTYFAERVQHFGGRLRFLPIEHWRELDDFEGLVFRNCCTLSLLAPDYPPWLPPRARLLPPAELDWKGWMALAGELAELRATRLAARIPRSHLLPLPRDGVLAGELRELTIAERGQWIAKPVGDWGGHGLLKGWRLSRPAWQRLLFDPPANGSEAMLLQRRIESAEQEVDGIAPGGAMIRLSGCRNRISPYYLLAGGRACLLGVMLVLRRNLKVHGATDAAVTLVLPPAPANA